MIVRQSNAGWTIVFHTSHGLLAQRIASHLRDARKLPFWFETQVAIGLHDDLHAVFRAAEREHLTEAGAPRDFALVPMRDRDRVDEMKNRIDEAYRKHTWMGIVQSRHAECLYAGEDVSDEMLRMLADEAKRREEATMDLQVVDTAVLATYDWMHFCDRLSLILCGDDVPAMNRRMEIITVIDGQRFEIWNDSDERICVAPWPFIDTKVELSIECRTVKQLQFDDDAELCISLRECPVERRSIVLFQETNP